MPGRPLILPGRPVILPRRSLILPGLSSCIVLHLHDIDVQHKSNLRRDDPESPCTAVSHLHTHHDLPLLPLTCAGNTKTPPLDYVVHSSSHGVNALINFHTKRSFLSNLCRCVALWEFSWVLEVKQVWYPGGGVHGDQGPHLHPVRLRTLSLTVEEDAVVMVAGGGFL